MTHRWRMSAESSRWLCRRALELRAQLIPIARVHDPPWTSATLTSYFRSWAGSSEERRTLLNRQIHWRTPCPDNALIETMTAMCKQRSSQQRVHQRRIAQNLWFRLSLTLAMLSVVICFIYVGKRLPIVALCGIKPSEVIDLREKGLGVLDAVVIAMCMSVNQNLKTLKYSHNRLSLRPNGAKAIAAAIRASTSLTSIDLSGNEIGDAGAKHIAEGIRASTSLARIDLIGNNIGDEGAKALGQAIVSTSLAHINLAGNNIGDEGAKALGQAIVSTSLAHINLAGNNIGDEGAKALGQAIVSTSLAHINLAGNNIGDEGAKALGQAIVSTSLAHINLNLNHIGDEGAPT